MNAQIIHASTIPKGDTVSERCERCGRLIWCFRHEGQEPEEPEGTCYRGHSYPIAFDAPLEWSRVNGRCMDCGTKYRMSQRHEGLNPWRVVNERQRQCNNCSIKEARATGPSQERS